MITLAALLAAVVTAYQLSRPGSLFGTSADVAVYLGGSIRLVHGVLPYRDFVFVQPPGFVLLATPVAFLSEVTGTRDALAVLRLGTPFLAAASVVLVGYLVRHRGVAATLIACGVMALFPAQLYALHSVLLEPTLEFLCLAGAALVFNGNGLTAGARRLVLGGAAFGLAGTVKVSAIIPVIVVAALCLPEVRRRLLPFVGGVIAGCGLPALPFIVAAPGSFFRDVVATQVGRIPSAGRVPLPTRLGDLTGISAFSTSNAAAIGATLLLAAVVGAAFVVSHRALTSLERFAVGSTVLVGIAELLPSQYYPHYAALITPFLALLSGLALARLGGSRAIRGVALSVAGVAVLTLLVNQVSYLRRETSPDVEAAVDAVIPVGGCVISDAPRNLVTTDRFQSTRPGCTDMTDPNGTMLALGNTVEAAAVWRSAFSHVDYVVVEAPIGTWPIDPAATAYVARNFRLVRSGGLLIYVRHGVSAGTPVK